jgi:hypothetical protein
MLLLLMILPQAVLLLVLLGVILVKGQGYFSQHNLLQFLRKTLVL